MDGLYDALVDPLTYIWSIGVDVGARGDEIVIKSCEYRLIRIGQARIVGIAIAFRESTGSREHRVIQRKELPYRELVRILLSIESLGEVNSYGLLL